MRLDIPDQLTLAIRERCPICGAEAVLVEAQVRDSPLKTPRRCEECLAKLIEHQLWRRG